MATSRTAGRLLASIAIAELAAALGMAGLAFAVPARAGGFLAGAAVLLIGGTALLLLARGAKRRYQAYQDLKARGRKAEARVTGMRTTGVYSRGQPYARISLEVTDGFRTYAVEVKDVVPMLLTGRLTDGRPIPVLVDPADAARVLIDWDAMLPVGGSPD